MAPPKMLVTGAAGLVGSECVRQFSALGWRVVGIDDDSRARYFGPEASTSRVAEELMRTCSGYRHHRADIRDINALARIFDDIRPLQAVIHTAAQPSHDWAARDPFTDFDVNARGTLNLLELSRQFSPEAVFVYMSTNKVYGDAPNRLPLVEWPTRWEVAPEHRYAARGIDEEMSVDQTMHSLFGVSKLAGDLLVQEYGRYFGMPTGIFRAGCLTGPQHAGVELHGFLAYLMKCAVTGRPYTVYGYKGKQVRDNLHCADLVEALRRFIEQPKVAAVYNIGGGRYSHCSLLEAIQYCEELTGRRMNTRWVDEARQGDHIWWISDVTRFQTDYPGWSPTRSVPDILEELMRKNRERWLRESLQGT